MPTPIAIAVVEHDGRFLIGRRPAGVPLAGLWEFPGGKIHSGETPEAAAVRECLEETGLAVEPLFRLASESHDYAHDRVELLFIACRLAAGETRWPQSPFVWVSRTELACYEFPAGNRRMLERLRSEGSWQGVHGS